MGQGLLQGLRVNLFHVIPETEATVEGLVAVLASRRRCRPSHGLHLRGMFESHMLSPRPLVYGGLTADLALVDRSVCVPLLVFVPVVLRRETFDAVAAAMRSSQTALLVSLALADSVEHLAAHRARLRFDLKNWPFPLGGVDLRSGVLWIESRARLRLAGIVIDRFRRSAVVVLILLRHW